MKIVAGIPVRGKNFFPRKNLIDKTWTLIETGNHILIAAPRRVGKTSLMFYMQDNLRINYMVIYIITQSVNNENEFFRILVNKVLKSDFVKGSQKVIRFLEKHKPIIRKVGPDGIEFGVKDDYDYKEMLSKILKSSQGSQNKLIIMIDEFPETLENIIKDENERAGIHFLQSNRELRQDSEITQNVQFIYTGSIGLDTIVSRLNEVSTINDLARLKIDPLTKNEAKELLKLLSKNVNFSLSEQNSNYILRKIEWLIPFYIQLTMQELEELHGDGEFKKISTKIIDKSFDEMLEQRQHFEHWHTRLRATLKSDEYNFAKELLNNISESEKVHSNEIFNLGVKYHLQENVKDYVGSLIYDGYINNNDDPEYYRFNSPILRMWWRKNVAN